MKAKSTNFVVFNKFLTALILLTFSSVAIAQAQNSSGLWNFEFNIEETDTGIKLHSSEGSAWIDLSFSLARDETQAIDQNGMVEGDEVSSASKLNITDYLITITKKENEVVLTGIKGTAWEKLSFMAKENIKYVVNQNGIKMQE